MCHFGKPPLFIEPCFFFLLKESNLNLMAIMCTYICMKAQRRTGAVYSVLFNVLFSRVFNCCCTKLYCYVEQGTALLPQPVVQFVVEQLIYFSTPSHFTIQGIHKRMVRFQKLTRYLFLTLHGRNTNRQQQQLSMFLARYQQLASHAYCGASFQDGVVAGKGFLCASF